MADAVTHAELDAAAEEVEEEVPEETEDTEVVDEEEATEEEDFEEEPEDELEEPVDHQERSNLGRRVSGVEDQIGNFIHEMRGMMAGIQRQPEEPAGQPVRQEEQIDMDDPIPMNMGDLIGLIDRRMTAGRTQIERSQTNYEQGYISHVSKIGGNLVKGDYDEITKEMLDNFNVRHSDNAPMDAELNFTRARNAILEKRMAGTLKKKIPLKGGKGKRPLGGASGTKTKGKKGMVVKLDPYASDFIKKTGMKEDDVEKALTGEAPAYLRSKM